MLGRPRARAPTALRAGAPTPAPTPGSGQPSLPFHAPAPCAAPGHLRGTRQRGSRRFLPRGTAGGLHQVGEVAAARPHGHGPVDSGQGVGSRHADQFHVPPLRHGTRGQSPRPVGLPPVGKCQRDMAPLAQRRGDGNPAPKAARPVATLPAEGGPIPAQAGARRGPGAHGRVPVPPLRHVPGGPRCPHGSQPGRRARPQGLPLPGPAAPAAPQPLPLGRLRWPPAGGQSPTPPAGWRWPQDFIQDSVPCARVLAWTPGLQKSPRLSWPWVMRHFGPGYLSATCTTSSMPNNSANDTAQFGRCTRTADIVLRRLPNFDGDGEAVSICPTSTRGGAGRRG